MTKDETAEREQVEAELFEELGFAWKRQNSALTVTIFRPEFKVESLHPAVKDYTAHVLLDKGWQALITSRLSERRMRQRLERTKGVLEGLICPDCEHTLKEHLDKYGCEHDCGDGYTGSDVLQALGPCGCTSHRDCKDMSEAEQLLKEL